MKYILEFNQYHQLNEGGGAGKNFEFDEIGYDIKFQYSKDGLKLVSKEVTLGDKLDIIGYYDGQRNIPTDGLFETDIQYTFSEEKLAKVTVAQVIYFVGEGVLFEDYDENTTFKEIVEKGDTIDIQITGSGSVEHMYGAGWLTPSVDKDTEITIDITDISGEWAVMDYIDDVNVQGLMFPYMYFADKFKSQSPEFSASIVLKATQKFVDTWNDIFNSDDEDLEDED